MPRGGFVYILGSDTGTLYIGVTSNLVRRVLEHKRGEGSAFTTKYRCHRLLYYELFHDVAEAISREKELKGKTRAKKSALIRTMNPEFRDLAHTLGWLQIGPYKTIQEAEAELRGTHAAQNASGKKGTKRRGKEEFVEILRFAQDD